MLHFVIAWASLLLLLPATLARADEFRGKVLKVVEGDLLTVSRDGKPTSLRLLDADCPEKGQPFATKASELTSTLVLGKTVVVSGYTDVKGQLVGKVSFQKIEVVEVMRDDRVVERRTKVQASLEEELIRAGLAWTAPGPTEVAPLRALEKEARAEKRGLWADAGAIPPWEWRQGKRGADATASIRIVNRGTATAVVDLTEGRRVVSCEEKARPGGEKWVPCLILPPFCAAPCAQKACPECAPPRPNLVHLAPGKSVELRWSGKLYRLSSFEHRSGDEVFKCSCYDAHDPTPGRYRVGVCLEAKGRGGPKVCHSTEVQLPGARAIEISITR